VLSNSGELERQGDEYQIGTPAAEASDEDSAEGDLEDIETAEAAE
jgi:hypothetical protein